MLAKIIQIDWLVAKPVFAASLPFGTSHEVELVDRKLPPDRLKVRRGRQDPADFLRHKVRADRGGGGQEEDHAAVQVARKWNNPFV